jgi:hypothetical protein
MSKAYGLPDSTRFYGNIRMFSMSTINEKQLTDHSALALGISVGYQSALWKGFRILGEGQYVGKLFSTNLLDTTSSGQSTAKWERELFDIQNPQRNNDILRFHKLYLSWTHENTLLKLGRQEVESPLVNFRDGRMNGFCFGGVHASSKLGQHMELTGFWLNQVLVRSTTEWLNFNDAIGLVSRGKNPKGQGNTYQFKTNSRGVGALSARWNTEKFDLTVWNIYLDKLSNSVWLQIEQKNRFSWGLQMVHQNHLDAARGLYAYQGSSTVYSGKIAWEIDKTNDISLSGLRVTKEGSFLFPRELGRDDFYTSMSRLRLDGLGDAWISNLRFARKGNTYKQELALLYLNAPDWNNWTLNKYEIQDQFQLNYTLSTLLQLGKKEGQLRFLYVFRHDLPQMNQREDLIRNKTNFQQFNLIGSINI